MLHALEADAAQCRESQQQLGKAAGLLRVVCLAVFLQGGVDFLSQGLNLLYGAQTLGIYARDIQEEY